MSSLGSNANLELPPIDEHLVIPESGYEMDDGKLVRVPPALEPHANRNSKLAALLEAHVADDFDVAVDMLTRISRTSDRAPDASVYPRARDPKTGGRQLEHLAFEIASTESLGRAGHKAAGLSGRGVRRVFAIDIERERVFEWSRPLASWSILDSTASLVDPALAVPLPIRTLLLATKADDAVAAALLAKGNPVLQAFGREQRSEGLAEGRAEGLAEALLAVLASRALPLAAAEPEQILRERDPARLARWLARAASCSSAAELLAIP